jgi:hypothetical protein
MATRVRRAIMNVVSERSFEHYVGHSLGCFQSFLQIRAWTRQHKPHMWVAPAKKHPRRRDLRFLAGHGITRAWPIEWRATSIAEPDSGGKERRPAIERVLHVASLTDNGGGPISDPAQ